MDFAIGAKSFGMLSHFDGRLNCPSDLEGE